MGLWQWHRLEHRLDRNTIIERHLAADAVPVDTVLTADGAVDQAMEWTRVNATGRYLDNQTATVRYSTRDGRPGTDVVTPLQLADGTVLLVDRGWLSTDNSGQRPDDVPPTPDGQVTVTGWLRVDNGADMTAVTPTDGQVRAIASRGFAQILDAPVRRGYLDLTDQQPAASGSLEAEPSPELGQGPHFFYALQWWFFAALAIIGYLWFARDEWLKRRSAQGATHHSAQASEIKSA